VIDRVLPYHLKGLRGLDLAVGVLFEPIALLLLPVRGLMYVTDGVRRRWWTS
jgi:hypothetical protein